LTCGIYSICALVYYDRQKRIYNIIIQGNGGEARTFAKLLFASLNWDAKRREDLVD